MTDLSSIRPSSLAGKWCPSDKMELQETINSYINFVETPKSKKKIIGLIVPHAGYYYSGQTAAFGYKMIQNEKPETVFVFSPLHSFKEGSVFSSSHSAYQTPLGNAPVYQELIEEIKNELSAVDKHLVKLTNDSEHSVEIQIPFLQSIFSHDFNIVPLMLRTQDVEFIHLLAEIICKLVPTENSLFIASTDLSHFHSSSTAEILDTSMIEAFGTINPSEIISAETSGKGSACGAAAAASLAAVCNQLGHMEFLPLKYSHSGEISGDNSSVVGYFSGAYGLYSDN